MPTPELSLAQQGDVDAFHRLFAPFQDALASYLYRLTAHREEAADLLHDTFLQAFETLPSFKGNASLKTWVFTIATNLAWNRKRVRKRWTEDTKDRAKATAHTYPEVMGRLWHTHHNDPEGAFFIREHISACFTCMAKTLPIVQQIAIILKDIYGFPTKDIATILNRTEGVVKHLLHRGRADMRRIYENRCALISKKGVCYQCSQLNDVFNGSADTEAQEYALPLLQQPTDTDAEALYQLRAKLVAEIDPLRSPGHSLQSTFMTLFEEMNAN